jgi:hypothetical protein
MPNSHYSQQWAAKSNPASSNKKKVRQTETVVTICRGLSHPTGRALWAALPSENFSRAEKTSEDITRRLFLMNMKGLNITYSMLVKIA